MASGAKLIEFNGGQKITQMYQCVITVTALCKCGNPEPLTVVMMVGVPLKAFCPRCETQFVVAHINFNIETGEPLTIALLEESKTIVTPPPGLKVQ